MIYTLTLNPSLDYYLKVDSLESDKIIRAKNSHITFGGKGINVSAVLKELGIKNTALGFVGGFTGEQLINMLNREGIDNDFIKLRAGETRINVKIKSDAEYDINAVGAPISEDDVSKLLVRINTIKSDDMLIISGSLSFGCSDDLFERIARIISENNAKIVFDTSSKSVLNVLRYKPFLLKPNVAELGEFFGEEIKTETDIINYAKRLQDMGALNVLVSCGDKGAILLTEQGDVKKTSAIKGDVISTTGCGDSMTAGFVAGYVEIADFDYALKLASACASATALSEGLCTKEKINEYLNIFNR